MVTRMTVKNQVTIPKRILKRMGFDFLKEEDRYFDVEIKKDGIFLKPVSLIIEERIPKEKWQKFEGWAKKIDNEDAVFDSAEEATEFLEKKYKKAE